MTRLLHRTIEEANDRHFPWENKKYKSTDKPWITDQVKRKIRQRKRAYNKNTERSSRWKILKAESAALIANNKKIHYQRAVEKLKTTGSEQIPYAMLSDIAIPERPNAWSINMLDPTASDRTLAEKLADFFVRITDEFVPINIDQLPTTYPSPFLMFQPHEVSERIRLMKKPNPLLSAMFSRA